MEKKRKKRRVNNNIEDKYSFKILTPIQSYIESSVGVDKTEFQIKERRSFDNGSGEKSYRPLPVGKIRIFNPLKYIIKNCLKIDENLKCENRDKKGNRAKRNFLTEEELGLNNLNRQELLFKEIDKIYKSVAFKIREETQDYKRRNSLFGVFESLELFVDVPMKIQNFEETFEIFKYRCSYYYWVNPHRKHYDTTLYFFTNNNSELIIYLKAISDDYFIIRFEFTLKQKLLSKIQMREINTGIPACQFAEKLSALWKQKFSPIVLNILTNETIHPDQVDPSLLKEFIARKLKVKSPKYIKELIEFYEKIKIKPRCYLTTFPKFLKKDFILSEEFQKLKMFKSAGMRNFYRFRFDLFGKTNFLNRINKHLSEKISNKDLAAILINTFDYKNDFRFRLKAADKAAFAKDLKLLSKGKLNILVRKHNHYHLNLRRFK